VVPERAGAIILSAFITHTAWHWMTERYDVLRAYRVAWPDAPITTMVVPVVIAFTVISVVAWLLSRLMARVLATRPSPIVLLLGVLSSGLIGSGVIAPAPVAAQTGRTTLSGVYTADQAKKGREVFTGFCAGCHTVASHSGPAFAARWAGHPLSEFFDYITRLMPKSAPGTLTEDEYVWVTAYVLKLNGMPPSPRELSAEPQLLRAIRIELAAGGDRDELAADRRDTSFHQRIAVAPRPDGRIPAGRMEKP
jgi:mono/diheme cytochrome c family protein